MEKWYGHDCIPSHAVRAIQDALKSPGPGSVVLPADSATFAEPAFPVRAIRKYLNTIDESGNR